MWIPAHFNKSERSGFGGYKIKRDTRSRLLLLYCNRCFDLVDLSPLESDIRESALFHSKMHDLAGPDTCGCTTHLDEIQLCYEESVENEDEIMVNDFRWLRVLLWHEEIGAKFNLTQWSDGSRQLLSNCQGCGKFSRVPGVRHRDQHG